MNASGERYRANKVAILPLVRGFHQVMVGNRLDRHFGERAIIGLMKPPEPIIVVDLFRPILDKLLGLLESLSDSQWQSPTVCRGWSVKDVALHLLGGDIGVLSRKRDCHSPAPPINDTDQLLNLVNELNEAWITAARRMSTSLLCDLLRNLGAEMCEYFKSLDPFSVGEPVSWAGPEPAPVWLDLAREYTEKWHHQQQIRDAVGAAPLYEPRYFAPVLDAFVRALPFTYRDLAADEGVRVRLTISGAAGGSWLVVREAGSWSLYVDPQFREPAQAELSIDQDAAWRVFTKGMSPETARSHATVAGDEALALKALETVSVIA
jgi:uncharacterized protein (TIGR03083 family)